MSRGGGGGVCNRKKACGPRSELSGLRLLLGDPSPEMTAAWLAAFPQGEETEIWQGNLFALDADALLSPANSFGDMSGGLDRAIDAFYAGAAQPRLLAAIQERFVGRWRLPVSVRG